MEKENNGVLYTDQVHKKEIGECSTYTNTVFKNKKDDQNITIVSIYNNKR
jgi:hypothetical protein